MSLQPSSQDSKIARKVLPAAFRHFKSMDKINFKAAIERIKQNDSIRDVSLTPIRYNNFNLEALMITPKNPSPYFIIHCRGNGEFIEDAAYELAQDAERTGCHVLAVNYPGIKNSTPTEFDTRVLIDSQIAVVNYLIEHHDANPEHILFKGHSLGAAIATLATLELHRENKKVYLFHGRGFSDLAAFLAYHARNNTRINLPEHWAMQVAKAYIMIDNNHKMLIAAEDDPTIPLEVSLYAALTSGYDINTPEMRMVLFKCTFKFISAHIAPLECLVDEKGQSAEQLFLAFVKQSFNLDHISPAAYQNNELTL